MPANRPAVAGLGALLLLSSSMSLAADVRLARGAGGAVVRSAEGAEIHLPLTNPRDLDLARGVGGQYWIAATEEASGGVRLRLFVGQATAEVGLPAAIPNPSGDSTLLQLSPIWLTTAGHPVLAWLEGHDIQRLSVRAATWTGKRWVHPRLVAPPAPGSQLALSGAVLEGKPVLAWAAFDGKDDEILWSRWDGRRWTRAQRLTNDNRIPDVTPSLTVISGRLLASWARFDGDTYRVVVSDFDGTRWAAPRPLGLGATSAPRFVESANGPILLARRTPPGSLVAYELDPQGAWSGRSASVVDPSDLRLNPSRIDVVGTDGQGVAVLDERGRAHELRWQADTTAQR